MTAITAIVLAPEGGATLDRDGSLWVGGLDTTCPTCGGRGNVARWVARPSPFRSCMRFVDCPDCNGKGHLSATGRVPVVIDGQCPGTVDLEAVPITELCDHMHRRHVGMATVNGSAFICDGAGDRCPTFTNRYEDVFLTFGLGMGWRPGETAYHLTGFRPEIDWPKPDETCPVGDPEDGPFHCGHWYDCEPCHLCGDDTIDMNCDCDRCTAARERRRCPFPVAAPPGPCLTVIEVPA